MKDRCSWKPSEVTRRSRLPIAGEWSEAFYQCASAAVEAFEIILLVATLYGGFSGEESAVEANINKVIPLLAVFVFSLSGLCSLFSSHRGCLLDDMRPARRGLNKCWLVASACLGVDLVLSFFLIIFYCLDGFSVAKTFSGAFSLVVVLLVVPRLSYEAAVAFRLLLKRSKPDDGSKDYIGPMLGRMKVMRTMARAKEAMKRGRRNGR